MSPGISNPPSPPNSNPPPASAAAQLGTVQHQLRAPDTGQQIVADLHLLFPQAMPIGEAHHLATEFETKLAETLYFPIEIISHLEPLKDHE